MYATLRIFDYDFDVYHQNYSIPHIHRNRKSFGIAMATNLSSLLVGAPFADYGNRRDVIPKRIFTLPESTILALAKGKSGDWKRNILDSFNTINRQNFFNKH